MPALVARSSSTIKHSFHLSPGKVELQSHRPYHVRPPTSLTAVRFGDEPARSRARGPGCRGVSVVELENLSISLSSNVGCPAGTLRPAVRPSCDVARSVASDARIRRAAPSKNILNACRILDSWAESTKLTRRASMPRPGLRADAPRRSTMSTPGCLVFRRRRGETKKASKIRRHPAQLQLRSAWRSRRASRPRRPRVCGMRMRSSSRLSTATFSGVLRSCAVSRCARKCAREFSSQVHVGLYDARSGRGQPGILS